MSWRFLKKFCLAQHTEIPFVYTVIQHFLKTYWELILLEVSTRKVPQGKENDRWTGLGGGSGSDHETASDWSMFLKVLHLTFCLLI